MKPLFYPKDHKKTVNFEYSRNFKSPNPEFSMESSGTSSPEKTFENSVYTETLSVPNSNSNILEVPKIEKKIKFEYIKNKSNPSTRNSEDLNNENKNIKFEYISNRSLTSRNLNNEYNKSFKLGSNKKPDLAIDTRKSEEIIDDQLENSKHSIGQSNEEFGSHKYGSAECTPLDSIDESMNRASNTSSSFYKALKKFQEFSDPNILKEELWASRKIINKLEKVILEKNEEIRNLKALNSDLLDSGNEVSRKTVEEYPESATKELDPWGSYEINSGVQNKNFSKLPEELTTEIEMQRKTIDEYCEKLKNTTKENALLHQLKDELEKENSRLTKVYNKHKFKINELKQSLSTSETQRSSAMKIVKNIGTKHDLSEKILEKYKHYKKKYKKIAKKESESRNYLHQSEYKINETIKEYNNFIKDIESKKNAEISDLKEKLSSIKDDGKKTEEIFLTLKQSEERYRLLFLDHSQTLEQIKELKDTNSSIESSYLDLLDKNRKLETELDNLRDQYETLLRQYSNSREEYEKDFVVAQKFIDLEEKIMNLEAEVLISKSKCEKYKKLLIAHNLISDSPISTPDESLDN